MQETFERIVLMHRFCLSCQFFSEVFPEWIQIDILYISMVQMNMVFFGSPLGLSGQDPVGGLVAGRFEAVFFKLNQETKGV